MDKFYQKVKEGGYNFERIGSPKNVGDRDRSLLLDPQAWVALGKAEGWPLGIEEEMAHQLLHHLFINPVTKGGSVDEFFNNLLSK